MYFFVKKRKSNFYYGYRPWILCACEADDNKHKKVIEIRLHNNEINMYNNIYLHEKKNMKKKKQQKYMFLLVAITINKILKFRHELAAKKLVFTPTLHQQSTCLMQFYGTRSCFQINILLFYRPIQGH